MASWIIDSHAHAFPRGLHPAVEPALQSLQGLAEQLPVKPPIGEIRRRARPWLRTFSRAAHQAQTLIRYFPEPMRRGMDELGTLAPLPSLLVESSVEDLLTEMETHEIDKTLLIAHPPTIPNEFVLDACSGDSRLLAVVNIPPTASKPKTLLKKYVERGAVALKIHPATDGEGPDSIHYRKLLGVAAELGLPVIIHTGCLHLSLFYKDPHQSRAERYKPWFEEFTETRFILAHMNYHEPKVAIDLMLEHPNVYVDTSWQPAEMISEAVRRAGAERILFGTDWPLLGSNYSIGLDRIEECVNLGWITQEQSKLILGENARKLLRI